MPQRILALVNWWSDHFYNFLSGLFLACITYFAEIKGTVVVMLAAFALDLVLGIYAAKKVKHEKFSMNKFFVAVERMLIACLLIMLLFAMGKEMEIGAELYKFGAWMITGFVGYSAAENGYQITGGKFFLALKELLKKKVEDNTGIDIDKTNQTV